MRNNIQCIIAITASLIISACGNGSDAGSTPPAHKPATIQLSFTQQSDTAQSQKYTYQTSTVNINFEVRNKTTGETTTIIEQKPNVANKINCNIGDTIVITDNTNNYNDNSTSWYLKDEKTKNIIVTKTETPVVFTYSNTAKPTSDFAGYWIASFTIKTAAANENWAPEITATQVSKKYKTVMLFNECIHKDAKTYTTIMDGNPSFDLTKNIAILHSNGATVLLTVGGAGCEFPSTNNKQIYWDGIKSELNKYDFDGVDFDFEYNSQEYPGNEGFNAVQYLMQQVHEQKSISNKSMLVTMVPQSPNVLNASNKDFATECPATSGTVDGWNGCYLYKVIMPNISIIHRVYVQYYNQGNIAQDPIQSVGNVVAVTDGILKQNINGSSLPPNKLVIGSLTEPLSGTNYGDSKTYLNSTILEKALMCIKGVNPSMCGTTSPSSIYPDLGGVMGWEINYDAVGSIRPEKG